MRSNKYLWDEVCMPIYRQMYKEAEPSADFDKLIESNETTKRNWYEKFFLSQERQKEIFDTWCKKKKVTRLERKKLSMEIWIGSAPVGTKEESLE